MSRLFPFCARSVRAPLVCENFERVVECGDGWSQCARYSTRPKKEQKKSPPLYRRDFLFYFVFPLALFLSENVYE